MSVTHCNACSYVHAQPNKVDASLMKICMVVLPSCSHHLCHLLSFPRATETKDWANRKSKLAGMWQITENNECIRIVINITGEEAGRQIKLRVTFLAVGSATQPAGSGACKMSSSLALFSCHNFSLLLPASYGFQRKWSAFIWIWTYWDICLACTFTMCLTYVRILYKII